MKFTAEFNTVNEKKKYPANFKLRSFLEASDLLYVEHFVSVRHFQA